MTLRIDRLMSGWMAVLGFVLAASALSLSTRAQAASTGGHYAARRTDTGFAGLVNSSGGYNASVPLDLPESHGGLPIPLHIIYDD